MKLQHFLVGILVAGAFVVGMTFFAGGLQQTSGITVNTSFNETYNTVDEMLELSSGATDQLTGEQIEETESGEELEKAGFSILKSVSFVTNSFSLVNTLIEDTADAFNIDEIWATILITIISITLLFAIIAALFGRNV